MALARNEKPAESCLPRITSLDRNRQDQGTDSLLLVRPGALSWNNNQERDRISNQGRTMTLEARWRY
jgi:hypothetical protein